VLFGEVAQALSGDGVKMECGGIVAQGLGGELILAIGATEIAPQHAETHRLSSRKSMEKRLLFDGIVVNAGSIVERNSQHAIEIAVPHLADASLSGTQLATVTTGGTNQRTFFKRNEQFTGAGVVIE